ncbi:MAG: hypothetical protein H7Y20_14790 [Bryobacteraceae bacterium]|nr:hypothetical protein [Bryobacteraceae bacterium]
MSFYDRYELLDLTRDGAVKTYAGKQKGTGRLVSIHLFAGGRAAHPLVMERLSQLPEAARAEILETGEHEGTVCVVTAPWKYAGGFSDWVLAQNHPAIQSDGFAKAGSWRVPTIEFGKKSAQATNLEPGEFTKMFQSPRTPGAGGATPSTPEPVAPKPPADPDPPPQPSTPVAEPGIRSQSTSAVPAGEFTRQFRLSTAPPFENAPERLPIAEVKEGGEFTRQFRLSTTPIAEVKQSGEFTRQFQMPAAPVAKVNPVDDLEDTVEIPPTDPVEQFDASDGGEAAVSTPMAPAPPSVKEPGEFTRQFQAGVKQVSPIGEAAPEPAGAPPIFRSAAAERRPPTGDNPGEFTRLFQAGRQAPPTGEPRPAAPPVAPPAPAGGTPLTEQPSSGGSEFTKFFQPPPVKPGTSAHPAFREPFGSKAPSGQSGQRAGEFTQMFGIPGGGHQGGPGFNVPQPKAPAAPPAPAPPTQGAFTRMFSPGAPAVPSTPGGVPGPPPPPAYQPPQFQAPKAPQPQYQAPKPAPPQSQDGGDFTRMFQTPAPPSALTPQPQAPVPVAAAPPTALRATKKAGYLPLIIGLGLLLLAAIVLIAIFALKGKP